MFFRYFHAKTEVSVDTKLPPPPPIVPGFEREFNYKEYPRFPQHPLPEAPAVTTGLSTLLDARVSFREFDATQTLNLTDLGAVLAAATRIRNAETPTPGSPEHRRQAPSGGGLYPLEYYVAVRHVEKLSAGLYHYRIRTHALEALPDASQCDALYDSLTYPFSKNAAAILVITAVWPRVTWKYGDLSYRLALLEAGHVSQNALLAAAAAGVGACPLAGIVNEKAERALDIAEDDESIIHAIALGR